MGINRELAGRVADAIETRSVPSLGFDMSTYGCQSDDYDQLDVAERDEGCGTVACMAGFTVALADGFPAYEDLLTNERRKNHIHDRARDLLGLSEYEAVELFLQTSATEDQAVKHLRIIAAGGDVDWHQVIPA